MSLERYIEQYEKMSTQNPMDPRERYFYMGKSNGEHCLVLTDISIFDDTIHISSIQTRPAGECEGKGFASQVLGRLVSLADENDVVMSLDPTPFAQATIDSEGLESWYARNGFVDDPEFGGMRRSPRVSEATRKPRKKGQRRKSSKHSDLYTDEDPKGTIKGLGFKDAATARKGVATVNKANRTHAHKVQATLVMVQRGKVAIERTKDPEKKKNLRAANKIWSSHLEKLKKKTKAKNETYIRKYVRKLLTEAAKDVEDLESKDLYIAIARDKFIKIFYSDEFGYEQYADDSSVAGHIIMFKSKNGCEGSWEVMYASAQPPGWGPLLYDVAMEVATMEGSGLMSDRSSVSRDARRVWDYYNDNRPDVTKRQLDKLPDSGIPGPQLTPDRNYDDCDQDVSADDKTPRTWYDSSSSKTFKKRPATINALKDAGRLIEL